ncbi:MAG: hypothetical protein IT393_00080 [Nitrospirae bacterium]|nr:hypothetical protein [Nitrospirota bacterium]
MITIEIDEDIFNYLKSLAEPFTDTPSTVLRRVIFNNNHTSQSFTSTSYSVDNKYSRKSVSTVNEFMSAFLKRRYQEEFRSRSPYRTMFESDHFLVYFQNFNKTDTLNLWYRLSENSLSTLRNTSKSAMVCFTNPATDIVYEIPIKDIDSQARKEDWEKASLEVNIDPVSSRWRELDWNIGKYLIKLQELD